MGSFSRGYGYRFDLERLFPARHQDDLPGLHRCFSSADSSRGLFFHEEGYVFWTHYFGLSPAESLCGLVWQPFTYLFLHAGILHILFNLLYLAMFGADLEHMWGREAVLHLLFPLRRRGGPYRRPCPQASWSSAIRSQALCHDPDDWRFGRDLRSAACGGDDYSSPAGVAFPLPVTISMRIFVIVMGAIEFFSTIGATGDGVSHVCHLGGMLVGSSICAAASLLYNFRNYFSDWKRRRLRKKFEVYVRDHRDKPPSNPDNWVN